MLLAIESSCDESAVALFDPQRGLIGEWVQSQIERHQEYGGVVPELASREHLENLPVILKEVTNFLSDRTPSSVAVTRGPGLAACLALGLSSARALALAWNAELIGVNHLRGHAWSPFIPVHSENPQRFEDRLRRLLPHIGLIVSGGNTMLFELNAEKQIRIIAQTVDDAAGEALDKGAKMLGMPYPGGPLIERAAEGGEPSRFSFPRAFPGKADARFSFSGLKTSLRYLLESLDDGALEKDFKHVCASYQHAVVEALVIKTSHMLKTGRYKSLGLSGGVANNRSLRREMEALARSRKLTFLPALPKHTGDNAGMIAFAAWAERNHPGLPQGALKLDPSLPLDER